MADNVLFEREGPLVTLTINRPELRNPLGEVEDADAFSAASTRINADLDVKVVILTAAGSAFSAGGNIRKMKERAEAKQKGFEVREHYLKTIHRMVRAIWNIEVPVIAAVNGPAIGLGNDVACLADIRIASDKASFGASFLRMGLVPGDGGAWILPRVIGMSNAAELFFTADIIDPVRAKEIGLVSRIVPAAELMSAAKALAAKIAEQSSPSLRMTKRLLRDAIAGSFDQIMDASANMQALAHATPEHHAAVENFLNRAKK